MALNKTMEIRKPTEALSSDEPFSGNGPPYTHEPLSSHEPLPSNATLPDSQPASRIEPLSSKNLACPLIDKLPLEVRLNIYRLLLPKPKNTGSSADAIAKARRIYWKPSKALPPRPPVGPWRVFTAPNPAPRARARPRSPDSIDTAFFEVCKLVYEEAHQELITRSTVIIDIKDVKETHQFPALIAHMRRIEIRDISSDRARISEPARMARVPPPPFNMHDLGAWGVRNLTWIKNLLDAAPLLTSVVVRFEVLRVAMPPDTLHIRLPHDPSFHLFQSRLDDITVRAGIGPLECYAVGKWRARGGKLDKLEFRHFAVLNIYQKLASEPCECASKGLENFLHDMRAAKDPVLIWRRHVLGSKGILGEEAQRRCGDGDLVGATSMAKMCWGMMDEFRGCPWLYFDLL